MAGPRTKAESPDRTAAEALAIATLAYLAGEPEELERFLAVTGLGPDNLRRAAKDRDFLAAVLDHVTAYEPLLLRCAAALSLSPAALDRARRELSPPSDWDYS
jgi:hypothetical protein